MERPELLACRDVSLGYEGQNVLTHLNLSIRAGDYLCVVGDNGSGKSTLLRGLLGLLAPQSGEIWRRSCGGGPSATCLSRPGPSGTSPPRFGRWCSPAVSASGEAAFSTPPPRNRRH